MTKILLMGLGRWGANHVRVLKSLPIELYVSDLAEKNFEVAAKVGVTRDRFSTEQNATILRAAMDHPDPLSRESGCQGFAGLLYHGSRARQRQAQALHPPSDQRRASGGRG